MWGRRYNAKLLALATDKEGNVWLGGGFEGTVDFGGGPFENAKLNDDMFLAKLDPEGNHLWSKQIGDEGGGQSGQIATSIATLPDGSAIVAGELDGTADFGAGLVAADVGSDVFILKVSPTGLLVWQQVFSGEKWQRPKTVAVLPGGDIAVSGLFWSEIVCGDTWLTKDEQTGAFFARLDAEGEVIACSSVSPTMSADAAALAPQADGGLWVAGVFKGDVTLGAEDFTSGNDFDSFVARVDEKLSVTQAFTLTGPAAQLLWAGAAHPAGHFYLGGELTDDLQVQGETLTPAEGMKDAGFILRIAPDGTLEWAKRYGEGKRAVVTSVALDPSGNLLAVGDFQLGAISFGDKNSPHQTSGFAMFVAKMPP